MVVARTTPDSVANVKLMHDILGVNVQHLNIYLILLGQFEISHQAMFCN